MEPDSGSEGGEMSRVLLFADFGKGPVCVGRFQHYHRDKTSALLASRPGSHADATLSRTNDSRAWWLVVCENAETGRDLIARAWAATDPARRVYPFVNDGPAPLGRILDWGPQP